MQPALWASWRTTSTESSCAVGYSPTGERSYGNGPSTIGVSRTVSYEIFTMRFSVRTTAPSSHNVEPIRVYGRVTIECKQFAWLELVKDKRIGSTRFDEQHYW
jgi:hypothetical protein